MKLVTELHAPRRLHDMCDCGKTAEGSTDNRSTIAAAIRMPKPSHAGPQHRVDAPATHHASLKLSHGWPVKGLHHSHALPCCWPTPPTEGAALRPDARSWFVPMEPSTQACSHSSPSASGRPVSRSTAGGPSSGAPSASRCCAAQRRRLALEVWAVLLAGAGRLAAVGLSAAVALASTPRCVAGRSSRAGTGSGWRRKELYSSSSAR
jgi:hypothetical protein